MKRPVLFLFAFVLIIGCNKPFETTRYINFINQSYGNWDVVSYKVNGKNILDEMNFATNKIFFDEQQYTSDWLIENYTDDEEVSWGLNLDFDTKTFNLGYTDSTLEYYYSTRQSIMIYPISDTIFSTSWKIEKINKRYFRFSNLHNNSREEDIEIHLEK